MAVMDEILKGLGTWALVPMASIALAGYALSMIVGLHRTRSQQRTEFLTLWRGVDQMDDMSLEVAVRHLCGTYLPGKVIRRICRLDDCANGVFEVSQLWPLFKYDAQRGAVAWAQPEYGTKAKLAAKQRWCTAGYFALSILSLLFIAGALGGEPTKVLPWLCGINALLFGFLAFSLLVKGETLGLARKIGERWLIMLDDLGSQPSQEADHERLTSTDIASRTPLLGAKSS